MLYKYVTGRSAQTHKCFIKCHERQPSVSPAGLLPPTVELVQASQVIQERLQRLGDGEELQEAVNDDVEDGQEAQAHVAEVDGQILRLQLHGRVDLVGQALKVQLLRVFLRNIKRKCLLIALFPRG